MNHSLCQLFQNSLINNDKVFLARHANTTKNTEDRHGYFPKSILTKRGNKEIDYLINLCTTERIMKILCADTPQCRATAKRITRSTGLSVETLGLKPFSLGDFAGLTPNQLLVRNPKLALQLKLFRSRILSIIEMDLDGLESPVMLEERIVEWAGTNQAKGNFPLLIIASSSVLTMIGNLALGILPSNPAYKNIPFTTGGVTSLDKIIEIIECSIWPKKTPYEINTQLGTIIATDHRPSIGCNKKACVIIIPGAFGNSRSGPYSLYTRIGDALASQGLRSITYDPLGSGESTGIDRSLETDRFSLNEIILSLGEGPLVLIGHSTGANLISKFDHQNVISKIFLAPISDHRHLKHEMNFERDEISGICTHHGVRISSDILENEFSRSFRSLAHKERVMFCSEDRYTNFFSEKFKNDGYKVDVFQGGDHNFSSTAASKKVIEESVAHALDVFR